MSRGDRQKDLDPQSETKGKKWKTEADTEGVKE